jgi:hypothetical protein
VLLTSFWIIHPLLSHFRWHYRPNQWLSPSAWPWRQVVGLGAVMGPLSSSLSNQVGSLPLRFFANTLATPLPTAPGMWAPFHWPITLGKQ